MPIDTVQPHIRVRSIGDYVERATSLSSSWDTEESFVAPWFRGIGDADEFKLVPRLYREPDSTDYVRLERKIRLAFFSGALRYVASAQERKQWDWYFLMQHYRVPTRLLDWTESALVALYFALDSWKAEQDGCPAVWVLDPLALNKITTGKRSIVAPSDARLAAHLPDCNGNGLKPVEAPLPIAVHPSYTDDRMRAQCSKFTLHGSSRTPLDTMTELQKLRENRRLVRILIDATDKATIDCLKRSLAFLGVRNSSVFPDLEGLAKDIVEDYTPTLE